MNQPKDITKKAIILLSSGLDSTTSLYMAMDKGYDCQVLFINYGQRSLIKEREFSEKIAKLNNLKWHEVDLGWLGNISESSLNTKAGSLVGPEHLDSIEDCQESAKNVWVPNRNGLFISIAASFAEADNIKVIILGFNKEEAQTFPDNSIEFMDQTNLSLKYSTSNQVQVESPTVHLNKNEIYQKAVELKVPMNLLWSCYDSQDKPCRVCESCMRFDRAQTQS